jgi:hypothetical protein
VPPYNYVHHRAVTPDSLGEVEKAQSSAHEVALAETA